MTAPEVTARPGYRPFCPPELRSEVHEAGHAIVAHLQGIRVESIYVGPNGRGGAGHTAIPKSGGKPAQLRRHGIVLAAGEMAALAFGEERESARRGAGGDRLALAGILQKLDPRSDTSAALYDEAARIVADNLPTIARLANTLAAHSRLGGSEAERAVDAAIAGDRYVHLDDTGLMGRRRDLFEAAVKDQDLDAQPGLAAWLWNRAGWVALRGGPMPDAAEFQAPPAREVEPAPEPAS